MYFIVVGHLFPVGSDLIYTFSVPLFFIISGFLTSKKDVSLRSFMFKNWEQFVLPMILLAGLEIACEECITMLKGTFHWSNIPLVIINCIVGNQQGFGVPGLGAFWFVYTLLLLKIVFQYSSNVTLWFVLLPTSVLISYLLNHDGFFLYNSWINAFLTFPFFMLGNYARHFKVKLNSLNCLNVRVILLAIFFVCMLLAISILNGRVYIYKNSFGTDFALYTVGGIMGTGLIYIVSRLAAQRDFVVIRDLAIGNITTLGLHPIIILAIRGIYPHMVGIEYIIGFLIMLTMIPVIRFSKRKMSVLLGHRDIKVN